MCCLCARPQAPYTVKGREKWGTRSTVGTSASSCSNSMNSIDSTSTSTSVHSTIRRGSSKGGGEEAVAAAAAVAGAGAGEIAESGHDGVLFFFRAL